MTIRAPVGTQERAFAAGWILLATLGFSIGCVQGRCYTTVDCPAPRICAAGGVCVLRDAAVAPNSPAPFDAGGGEMAPSTADAEIDTTPGCPPLMAAVGGFCIDIYEASRGDATASGVGSDRSRACVVAGVLPWLVGDNAEAAQACAVAGKRLCSPAEWQLACEGPDQTTYAYGDSYNPTTCNGIDAFADGNFHLAPTGSFPGCTNAWGVFDMNGNVWEQVAGGTNMTVRGGAYNCSDSVTFHRCDYIPVTWTPSALGFRCCADGNAP